MLLKERGEELVESVNVEGEAIITPMFGAIRNWCGQIGVGKGEANGRLTI
ncbi:unnamed protein product [marine sediment metagenome]|uniref:Uncharacterized protein n=1 Tax=marine sediment metagenome TaxID=412755 RepID=X1P4Q4_9ZZZZ